ncbi:uncharacterized protein ASPGLDRAFT_68926 [Aspergillus glaucus CBS 516.65]|uniref:non-specific serine/threonine protein kinase n=1 Tax=Aspergillus glaucus CBS 516.65 TaxID=1160497 RepID=A0A1L9VBF4_ASPGL|nr:hypothetical protein ASPGLDRAFT_68926 [Aspergillus glaucus CBS 516.65]OJJ81233.1 hypothetical protein ASPGLDRAFT_68926 [Aspergillus glaucus CBS 516.65]
MDNKQQHSAKLVEQADLMSHKLIRVAVLWHELWHEGLEEASHLYFGDHTLPQLSTLDLKYVSPKLKDCLDFDLAVPGIYQSGRLIIRIISFDPILHVLQMKKRPRRMTLKGSDGSPYMYTLKGHEDIRQDEHVMQLFSLINTLLDNDGESFKRHLSAHSGLLGWVSNSDTLHTLIMEYRESRRILLNIEHHIMLQMASDYDNLTLMQKVKVFRYAMDNTTRKDLYSWLERRTNYTRSLGVMSHGYILSLGDHHPSNLLLDHVTGKIVHIDFSDCFEVVMHHEKYPERVPFQLTRMLIFAMEVSNIEGSYQITCEAVMRVLRENKDSLMAVLEAFIHDHLINWRLGVRESPPGRMSFIAERRQSVATNLNPENGAQPSTYTRPRCPSILEGGILDAQEGVPNEARELQNARALQVLARVQEKLTGRDFRPYEELDISDQVDKLLAQATNVENICQHWIGWCSFW